MKLQIDEEADALHLQLVDVPVVESAEVAPGVIVDYDDSDQVVGDESPRQRHYRCLTLHPSQRKSPQRSRYRDELQPAFNLETVVERRVECDPLGGRSCASMRFVALARPCAQRGALRTS